MWVCTSINPGRTVLGQFDDFVTGRGFRGGAEPTETILSPSMTMSWLVRVLPDLASKSFAA